MLGAIIVATLQTGLREDDYLWGFLRFLSADWGDFCHLYFTICAALLIWWWKVDSYFCVQWLVVSEFPLVTGCDVTWSWLATFFTLMTFLFRADMRGAGGGSCERMLTLMADSHIGQTQITQKILVFTELERFIKTAKKK